MYSAYQQEVPVQPKPNLALCPRLLSENCLSTSVSHTMALNDMFFTIHDKGTGQACLFLAQKTPKIWSSTYESSSKTKNHLLLFEWCL